jgi:uncharacterized protein
VSAALATVAVGLVSGVLSGMFGVGGGVLTTPAIRLLLGYPALVAVGTPLVVIIPTTAAGAIQYARRGLADVRAGLALGACGSLGALAGAWGSALAGGTAVLLTTAALIAVVSVDMLVHAARSGMSDDAMVEAVSPTRTEEIGREDSIALAAAADEVATMPGTSGAVPPLPISARLALTGLASGVYSGFLGLGGGFVMVPLLSRLFGIPMKRAIGTSLVAITVLAIPGSLAHWALGHVDLPLALLLVLGTVPGALFGARLTMAASERATRIGFAALLLGAGAWLGVSTLQAAIGR